MKQYITAMIKPETKQVLETRAKEHNMALSRFVSRVLDDYIAQPYTRPKTKEEIMAMVNEVYGDD